MDVVALCPSLRLSLTVLPRKPLALRCGTRQLEIDKLMLHLSLCILSLCILLANKAATKAQSPDPKAL